ncbi:peptide ABC transporter substrate-binding protein [Chlamydia muridarum str. Nigg]|uniref:Peptide ABC transporter substrate-binding protein n=2 Tax=Chlamydia muridarum TaxID=83560 RepID=A0A069ZY08_CHLMR|nr:peptide ABC transporter substrate-binding protein [Chlamydia muridarum]AAF39319.1 peptide ABC transporter, periplasmic peptide-binding protein, putative [Chlamydia muridarum str. Nigg]AHH22856.1 peptide ABC transporter substrate-binding protein [Chlamydia muridarum str. Nigg3 CMUT3-5]AHH23781.1 peptide ABC transporter substrate-binding protein [Chlamydia muridarum str. Nigg CM972]AID37991.1 peptide ABC transporter substrate-binding protein [Chlamydia muridarum str. Nigg 2 MCR]AIT90653.1 pep
MRKVSVGICLLIALATAITGCSKSSSNKSNHSSSNQSVSVSMKDDPRTFDPREVRLLSDINLIHHLYEGLVQETPSGEVFPALAESFFLSEDKKTYTFHLKKALWSNGDLITAHDFVRSWNDVLQNRIASIYSFAFLPIDLSKDCGFFAKDNHTLVINLHTPTPHFLKLLTLPVFYPVHPEHQIRNEAKALPISTGAFCLKEKKDRRWLKLEKNPYYYNKEQVAIQEIHIHVIPDQQTASALFKQGKLDWQGLPWGHSIPQEALATANKRRTPQSFDISGTSWLTFNTSKVPFSHPKLRQALSLVLNKEALASPTFVKPAKHLLPTHLHTYPEQPTYKQQEAVILAKTLLQEALTDLNMTIKDLEKCPLIFSATSSVNSQMAQMMRDQWRRILGITFPICGKEYALLQNDLTTNTFFMSINGWFADFSDPLAFLSVFSSKGIKPYALQDPLFDQLILSIETEKDPRKRISLISEASLYLEKQNIIEPLYHDVFHYAANNKLSFVRLHPSGLVDMRYAKNS